MATPRRSPTSPTCGRSRATSPLAIRTGSWWRRKLGTRAAAPWHQAHRACGALPELMIWGAMLLRQRATTVATLLSFFGGFQAGGATAPPRPQFPNSQLEPVAWSDLDGWAADNQAAAFTAFRSSCRAIVRSAPGARDTRPMAAALTRVCHQALAMPVLDADKARVFFEQNFRPSRIAKLGDMDGFLTGYYEPI